MVETEKKESRSTLLFIFLFSIVTHFLFLLVILQLQETEHQYQELDTIISPNNTQVVFEDPVEKPKEPEPLTAKPEPLIMDEVLAQKPIESTQKDKTPEDLEESDTDIKHEQDMLQQEKAIAQELVQEKQQENLVKPVETTPVTMELPNEKHSTFTLPEKPIVKEPIQKKELPKVELPKITYNNPNQPSTTQKSKTGITLKDIATGFLESTYAERGASKTNGKDLSRQIYFTKVWTILRRSFAAGKKVIHLENDVNEQALLIIKLDKQGQIISLDLTGAKRSPGLVHMEQILRTCATNTGLYPPIPKRLSRETITLRFPMKIYGKQGIHRYELMYR